MDLVKVPKERAHLEDLGVYGNNIEFYDKRS
jgi:hypothetical protein